ncbi:DUF5067 domain-containing protein [Pediococcus claussenii]|uniref:DUF5067 domain-containing protein n=1 Tax=Pediococcus claussenii (strain ATCC BAA-344 / DSM 14800 / JCM 18046 / KCTC 3811 / LMG 21948 / P06) TaxID=701521 RepID=G8PF43_PEDCP|nr:DUF5067 domain-containing protein [Pediococcus claussenii]AEV95722.1 hypothetical protein PECL_1500 [Pediococcus claussenii ATCC BAA-344]ANZ69230.1 hypothetical protein AYR57_02460 [Pediococcus claussenii]ANZ71049.1 hypothetical protein AYR58_02475 [Pediococcus claussenii]KRN20044.1 hypothetical protein IV79_GL000707 [Pediococcus claussenii]
MKKIVYSILLVFISVIMVGCSTQSKSKSNKTASSRSSKTSAPTQISDASFKNGLFTIENITFDLNKFKTGPSATEGKDVIIQYFTVTNHGSKKIMPSDLWYKYVVATQNINGRNKKLEKGSLPFSTAATKDNNLENASVSEMKPHDQIDSLGSWQMISSTADVELTFYDQNHKQVGTRNLNVNN